MKKQNHNHDQARSEPMTPGWEFLAKGMDEKQLVRITPRSAKKILLSHCTTAPTYIIGNHTDDTEEKVIVRKIDDKTAELRRMFRIHWCCYTGIVDPSIVVDHIRQILPREAGKGVTVELGPTESNDKEIRFPYKLNLPAKTLGDVVQFRDGFDIKLRNRIAELQRAAEAAIRAEAAKP